ncbi:MAG: hypothetical protein HQL95_00735 [Magnetococcales bacterium]|nr:hypothetical protein [Magnetococcales bacterium]
MADQKRINVTVGQQPILATINENRIYVTVGAQPVHVVVRNEIMTFVVPAVFSDGRTPAHVNGIAQGVPTVVARLAMPGKCLAAKWLLTVSDATNGLGVSSELNAFTKGGIIEFTEYAVTGDADIVAYEIDFVVAGDEVQMVFTSFYDGLLDVIIMQVGVFA